MKSMGGSKRTVAPGKAYGKIISLRPLCVLFCPGEQSLATSARGHRSVGIELRSLA